MFFQHIQRVLVVGCVGLIAGGVHSALREPIATKLYKDAVTKNTLLQQQVNDLSAQLKLAQENAGNAGALTAAAAPVLERDISIAQAKALYDSGANFIDARLREEFLVGHVANSFLLPSDAFRQATPPEALQYLDSTNTLVIYCGGGACDASHNTAFELMQRGFTKIHIMTDGYPAWKDAGHPTEVGAPIYEQAAPAGGGS